MKLELIILLITCVLLSEQKNDILNEFKNKLSFLTKQIGYETLTVLFKNISARTVPIEGEKLLDELSHAVETKFNNTKEALLKLRNAIESSYNHSKEKKRGFQETTSDFPDCCTIKEDLNNLEGRSETIHYNGCTLTPSYKNHEEFEYSVKLSKIMKENMANNKDLKWQYFTSVNGTMFLYPARKLDNCESFDPRNRSWFVETATVHPKDVVIVLDISGSMEMTNVRGKSLLKIVKTGANLVINTLNSNDKIGVVAFSDDIEIPDKYECFQQQLAVATPQNKMAINSFINRLKGRGLTNYIAGLKKAFDYFRNLNSTSNDRDRILLFLSDGMPTVGGGRKEILDLIRNETAYFNNTIIIMTFGIGKALQDIDNRQLLIDMANYAEGSNPNDHPLGRFKEVTCSDVMRRSMADYYIGLHTYQERKEPIFTLPYYDAGRLGYIMSQCLPVQADKEFLGVTCIDIKLSDLLDDIINFKHGELSYAFIINNNGIAVSHPLLPIPSSINEDVGLIDIKSLERDSAVRQVIKAMTEGKNGSMELSTQRTVSRGNGKRDGISVLWIKSTYIWRSIRGSNFSVCIVFNSDEKRLIFPDQPVTEFLYHNFQGQNFTENRTCKLGGRIIAKKKTVVKFGPNTFQNSLEYKNGNETKKNISDIVKYMKGENNFTSLFQEGIRASVAFTEPLEKFWKENEALNNDKTYFIWKYVATINGILRIYPGVFLNKLYDARHRSWFQRTLSNKGKLVISRPYNDYWGAGNIITVSRAICKQSCTPYTDESPALAVIAGDIRVDYFHELLISSINICKIKNKCFIVDSSGYIILHDDFIYPHNGEISQVEAVHMAVKEPYVTNTLVSKGILYLRSCIDVMNMENKYFWELSFSHKSYLKTANFSIYNISNTNAFLIVKQYPEEKELLRHPCKEMEEIIKREIPQDSISCTEVENKGEITDCSCRSDTVFNYCENTFDLTKLSDLWPICIPEMPQPDMTNQENSSLNHHVYSLCSDIPCSNNHNRSDCLTDLKCQWCSIDKLDKEFAKPVCAEKSVCKNYGIYKTSKKEEQSPASTVNTAIIIIAVLLIIMIICIIFICLVIRRRKNIKKRKEDKSKLLGNQVRVSLVELGKDNASMLWGNFNEGNSVMSVIPEGIQLEQIPCQSRISSSSDSIHVLAQKVEALVHRLESQDSIQPCRKINGTALDRRISCYSDNLPSNRSSTILPSSYHSSLPRTISCSSVLSSPKSSSLPSSNGYKIVTRTPSSESPFHSQSHIPDEQTVVLRPKPGRKGKFFSRAPSEGSWPGEYPYHIYIPFSNTREPSERTCPQSGVSQCSREREPSESSYRVEDNDWSDIPEENAEAVSANDAGNDISRNHSSSFRQRINSKNILQRRRSRNTRPRSLSSPPSSESIRSFIRQCIQTVAAEEENARQQTASANSDNTSTTFATEEQSCTETVVNCETNAENNILATSSFAIEKEKTN